MILIHMLLHKMLRNNRFRCYSASFLTVQTIYWWRLPTVPLSTSLEVYSTNCTAVRFR
nr:MAG TPA: hypothetical protein [Caudoviricetes sp.]